MTHVAKGWVVFFWIAAAYNLLIGAGGFFDPMSSQDERALSLLVFAFGIIYALVARAPLRMAPALWAGVFGKFAMVALFLPAMLAPGGEMWLAAILIGDIVFALGFLAFLLGPARGATWEGESK